MLRPILEASLKAAMAKGVLPTGVNLSKPAFDAPPKGQEGDVATNAAFLYAKVLRQSPKDLAQLLKPFFEAHENIEAVHIAGPGFLNLTLNQAFLHSVVGHVLEKGWAFGRCATGVGRSWNVEYVSVNPTGPLHVGHGRVAVVGDVLANLLEAVGFRVVREYYVNDAGGQVAILARSVHLRYREAFGEAIGPIPEGCYPGDYLKEVGQALKVKEGDRYLNQPEEVWQKPLQTFAVDYLMGTIRQTLEKMGIQHDVFCSEKKLCEEGALAQTIQVLKNKDLAEQGALPPPKGREHDWQSKPTLLFKATALGEAQDVALLKAEDGSFTYFAGDVAYHQDKLKRGFDHLLNIWGADHAGHVGRLKAAVQALSEDGCDQTPHPATNAKKPGHNNPFSEKLAFVLCQMVHVLKGGKPLKLSKRAGNLMLLDDLIDALHIDVVRFLMVSRSHDAQLTLDLDEAMATSKENPVFYVHYAYARGCSLKRMASKMFPDFLPASTPTESVTQDQAGEGARNPEAFLKTLSEASLKRLDRPLERQLMQKMAFWPQVLEGAAMALEAHRIPTYLTQLASLFHALWAEGKDDTTLRFLVEADHELSLARMALVQAMLCVMEGGLNILGITPRDELF